MVDPAVTKQQYRLAELVDVFTNHNRNRVNLEQDRIQYTHSNGESISHAGSEREVGEDIFLGQSGNQKNSTVRFYNQVFEKSDPKSNTGDRFIIFCI